jgi:hypothetical protein
VNPGKLVRLFCALAAVTAMVAPNASRFSRISRLIVVRRCSFRPAHFDQPVSCPPNGGGPRSMVNPLTEINNQCQHDPQVDERARSVADRTRLMTRYAHSRHHRYCSVSRLT